jgi:hypothetical protein
VASGHEQARKYTHKHTHTHNTHTHTHTDRLTNTHAEHAYCLYSWLCKRMMASEHKHARKNQRTRARTETQTHTVCIHIRCFNLHVSMIIYIDPYTASVIYTYAINSSTQNTSRRIPKLRSQYPNMHLIYAGTVSPYIQHLAHYKSGGQIFVQERAGDDLA